ncbi:SDR family NAD(P)-dependent oxidoreductase [Hymenobacter sp. RP-2-7]|uniref:SDR family NAD(P)-dependent oxidoreductase n=1 Tax=Hymenobacter polaris TaxID=2682546 RepID=A0A7Y0ADA5_9BACT|nr:SDR family NAD(P)-dependent oxidoreductase [Hymenobacter polaris]NML65181.1 SDR family NAD(P)-dependent oxidoreductase [Hymenobacter polaris]
MPHSILITGGHTGLGLATSRALLATTPDAHLIWATRSRAMAEQAAASLPAPGRLTILPLDLNALASVHHFADELLDCLQTRALPPLQAIVCNAGIQFADGQHWTTDGIEQTFGVNYLAHFALVERLLPALEPAGRLVLVGSGTHFDAPRVWTAALFGMPPAQYLGAAALARGEVPADLDPASAPANQFRYSTSKLCTLLYMYELNRRLRDTSSGVTVTTFDPGLMPGTGLGRANHGAALWAWQNVLPVLRLFPGVHSTETSGRNLAWLAADPAVAGVTGQYFEGRRAVPSSALARQSRLWADLWAGTEQLLAAQPAAVAVGG